MPYYMLKIAKAEVRNSILIRVHFQGINFAIKIYCLTFTSQ